jgi:hypothetical protein
MVLVCKKDSVPFIYIRGLVFIHLIFRSFGYLNGSSLMSMTTNAVSILKKVKRDEYVLGTCMILTLVSLIYLMGYLSHIPYTKDCSLVNISPDFTIQERNYCRGLLYPKNSSKNTTPKTNKKVLWI